MKNLSNGTWRGKHLKDMSRQELYEAIVQSNENHLATIERHQRDIELLEKYSVQLRKPWLAVLLGY